MMAPRQCQIHYRLSLFISTLEEKPLPCPFFLSIGPRGFSCSAL